MTEISEPRRVGRPPLPEHEKGSRCSIYLGADIWNRFGRRTDLVRKYIDALILIDSDPDEYRFEYDERSHVPFKSEILGFVNANRVEEASVAESIGAQTRPEVYVFEFSRIFDLFTRYVAVNRPDDATPVSVRENEFRVYFPKALTTVIYVPFNFAVLDDGSVVGVTFREGPSS